MRKSIKVRIYPSQRQIEFLNAQFGAVRFAYNKALSIKKHYYKRYGISLYPKKDIKPLLVVAKKSRKYVWMRDYDSIALQQAIINLDRAFSNFFNPNLRAKFPRFKNKRSKQTSYHCSGVAVGSNWIKIPKLDFMKARIHREPQGKLKSITLSRTASGKYHASLVFEDGRKVPKPILTIDPTRITGIDLGISDIITDSSCRKIPNPCFLKKAQTNLRRKHQALSRCARGSNGYYRARTKLTKAYEKINNVRTDFQHKISRQLIDDNQAVIVETLKIQNLLKNHQLAKYITDVSWYSLIEKLEYKAREKGKYLVKVDPWFASTKTCHICGYKLDNLPLNVRKWNCPECGAKDIDRDINAAINIKQQGIIMLRAEGLSVPANGGLHKSGDKSVAVEEVGSLAC